MNTDWKKDAAEGATTQPVVGKPAAGSFNGSASPVKQNAAPKHTGVERNLAIPDCFPDANGDRNTPTTAEDSSCTVMHECDMSRETVKTDVSDKSTHVRLSVVHALSALVIATVA
ncbi:hypothetical protein TcCL_NonESM04688 [Trypanosoma cruzi]|nr:hypothetical protein TcCL_NonESM04688 [Trypanosoma cruzi]